MEIMEILLRLKRFPFPNPRSSSLCLGVEEGEADAAAAWSACFVGAFERR